MKKLMMFLMVFTLFLAGCGGGGDKADKPAPAKPTAQNTAPAPKKAEASGKKILVAYFSWSGNTRRVAESIQQKTGADIFEIRPAKPYPKDYHECTEYAKAEKQNGGRPALAENVPNLADYDTVLLGYPIWWYDVPMIICTFL